MANTTIKVHRGTAYTINYTHLDSDGNPIDLTGQTVYFTVKDEEYDTDASDSVAEISVNVSSHSDPTNGVTTWALNDADTYLEPGTYYYSILVEDASNDSVLVAKGKFKVLAHPANRQIDNG